MKIFKNWKKFAIPISLVLLAIFLNISTEGIFLDPRNLTNLLRQVTVIGILALGMTFVILTAGIDLSVGSVVGVTGVLVALLQVRFGMHPVTAILLTVIFGAIIGLWNGFWIAKFNVPPFVITLGMMTIARGMALLFSGGQSISGMSETFAKLGSGYFPIKVSIPILVVAFIGSTVLVVRNYRLRKITGYLAVSRKNLALEICLVIIGFALFAYIFCGYEGIPYPVTLFIILALLAIFILRKTTFGRAVYAIGGNENAAYLSGVPVFRIKLLVYTLMSTLAAVSGIVLTSRLNGASPQAGNMFELDAIASVVIGGTSLSGGSGTIPGTLMGILLIGVLNNGMSLMNVPAFYQFIIKGLIIIFAVWFDVQGKKK